MRVDTIRVKELLAKIGVSLKESKEPYLSGLECDLDSTFFLFKHVKSYRND